MAEKILITGFSGFVSKYFVDYMESNNIESYILGVDINSNVINLHNFKYVKIDFEKVDLLDKVKIKDILFRFSPDYILHLASYSSVAFSWKNPVDSFRNNTNIFLNLIDAVRELKLPCRILSVGSSEEYGNVSKKGLPLREDLPLNPVSPYAVARVSQEFLSKVYVEGYGLDIVITRSFNHIGPGQKDIFVVSSFAKKLMEIFKSHKKTGELFTGDVSIIRDFTDVRDVVDAYYRLLKKGKAGEIYNICSGRGVSLEEVIELMSKYLNIKVETRRDKSLIRPADNRVIVGDNSKIKNETGWKKKIPLEKSLMDMLNFYQTVL